MLLNAGALEEDGFVSFPHAIDAARGVTYAQVQLLIAQLCDAGRVFHRFLNSVSGVVMYNKLHRA